MAADQPTPDTISGGTAAVHELATRLPARVAPTVENAFNQLVIPLIPIACVRVEDIRFAFDSSFVGPNVGPEMAALASLRDSQKLDGISPRVSIFGHADPVGDDDYNKRLSGRRALAIYGMLVRDTAIWESLYTTRIHETGDPWGKMAVQTMLATVGSGNDVAEFQRANGLDPDGDPGPRTRAALYRAYMDTLCGDLKLDKADDFLAGTDPDGKGDVQGCGEFNPVLIFSEEEDETFSDPASKADRDHENAPNRRVVIFLFQPGNQVVAEKFPCPRVKEGITGCQARFWSDAKRRRDSRLPDQRRTIQDTRDTFACRFYHRLAATSPCESPQPTQDVQLRLCDALQEPIPHAPCIVRSGGLPRTPVADEDGFVTVTVTGPRCDVEWTLPGHEGESFRFRRSVFMTVTGAEGDSERRLHNVGFSDEETLEENILMYQRVFGRDETGRLEDIEAELIDWHDGGATPPRLEPNVPEPSRDPVVNEGPMPPMGPPGRDEDGVDEIG